MDWSKYLKIPYEPMGRSHAGADCYGFYLIVQREIFGRDLSDLLYTNIHSRENAVKEQLARYRFEKVETPKFGSTVIMYSEGIPSHVGIYIGSGLVIHSRMDLGVVIEEAKNCDVEGYYESILL